MRCSSVPFLFLALPAWSCRPAPTVAAQDDHGHTHAESVQFTRWQKGYEIFCEYDIPVAGEPVRFIVHVTDTRTDEPRRSGAATLRFLGPRGARAEVVEETPAREGIYLPRVNLDRVGKWRATFVLKNEEGPVELDFPTIEVYYDEHEAGHANVTPSPGGIAFTKEQQWRLGTRIAPARVRELVPRIEVPGVVHVAQERQAIVSPPTAGRLESADGKAFPHLGTRVAQGQVLGYVRPPFSDYMARVRKAEAEIVRAQLVVERTQLVLERVTRLHARKARTEAELEKARFDVQLALSDYTAAESVAQALSAPGIETAETGEMRFELRSPITGVVVDVEAVNGSYAEPGDHLIHVRDSSVVHLEAMITMRSGMNRFQSLHIIKTFNCNRGVEEHDCVILC